MRQELPCMLMHPIQWLAIPMRIQLQQASTLDHARSLSGLLHPCHTSLHPSSTWASFTHLHGAIQFHLSWIHRAGGTDTNHADGAVVDDHDHA